MKWLCRSCLERFDCETYEVIEKYNDSSLAKIIANHCPQYIDGDDK